MALPPLRTKVSADTTGFVGGMRRATAALGGFKGSLGAGTAALAVFAGAKGLAGATRAFAKFDEAMTESQAIMGDLTQNQMAAMQQAAIDVSTQTDKSATEAAESFFFLASAGLDAEQSIAALPQVAQFAQAGMFSMARATDLATDAQSALGLKVDDTTQNLKNLTRVTDVLTRANQLANASVEQFSEGITNRLGARLRTLNKDVEEGTAALAAFADQGVKGRRAGRLLNILLRDLASGAVRNEAAFEELGIEIFNARGEMRPLSDIIADFENTLAGATDQQKVAQLEMLGLNKRASDVLIQFLGLSDEIREYRRELEDAGGATEEVAGKQLQTLNKQLGLLQDEVQAAKIQVGGLIAPEATKDVKALRIIVGRLREEVSGLASDSEEASGPIERGVKTALLQSLPEPFSGIITARKQWTRVRDRIIESEEATREFSSAVDDIPTLPGARAPQEGRLAGFTTEGRREEIEKAREEEQVLSAEERQRRELAKQRAREQKVLQEARNRLIEEELGLTSLALQREKEKLRTLIQQGAAQEEIANQAERVAELERERQREPGEEIIEFGTLGPTEGVEPRRATPEGELPAGELVEGGTRGRARAAGGAGLPEIPDTGFIDETAQKIEEGLAPAIGDLARRAELGEGAIASLAESILQNLGSFLQQGLTSGAGGAGFAGLFQHGGRIPSGQVGVVGEAGPELVRGPATVSPAGRGGGDRVEFNFKMDIRAMDSKDVERTLREKGGRAIVDSMVEAAKQSEAVSRALVTGSG